MKLSTKYVKHNVENPKNPIVLGFAGWMDINAPQHDMLKLATGTTTPTVNNICA